MSGYREKVCKRAIGVVSLLVLLLASCTGSGQTRLYAENDGDHLEIELGEMIEVALRSSPATGYSWEMVDSGDGVLLQEGEAEFQQEVKDRQLVGAGGVEILRFKAQAAGQTTLELVYHRPWEEDEKPVETFSVQVTVR